MTNEKSVVAKKIAKLLSLSESQNLSEAASAMQKAGTLMEEWGLSLDDIEMGQEEVVYKQIDAGSKRAGVTQYMNVRLAEFLGVKFWNSPSRRSGRNHLFCVIGFEADVAMFEFFQNMLTRVFESEWAAFKTTNEYGDAKYRGVHGKSIRATFLHNFTHAVNDTLMELVEQGESFKTKSGTSLVVVKDAKNEAYFEEHMNFKLVSRTSYRSSRTQAGSGAGTKAGSKVRFQKPVNGNGTTLAIC